MRSTTFAAVLLWRRWTLLCEYCTRARIIFHNITSEYNSTLVFLKLWAPTPNSWDDRGPLTTKKELFSLHSLLQRSPLFCFWLSSAAMLVFSWVFQFFLHCCFGTLIPWGVGINLCARLPWFDELFPFLACGLRDFYVGFLPNALS